MSKYEFLDPDRAIVIGLSNGGGFAPLVAKRHAVRAFVAAGSWGRTWYQHMLENERVRLTTERSGERRVGEEWRSRWAPDHLKKKKKLMQIQGLQIKRLRLRMIIQTEQILHIIIHY